MQGWAPGRIVVLPLRYVVKTPEYGLGLGDRPQFEPPARGFFGVGVRA